MTILVTGSTGTVGSQVIGRLGGHGLAVRALTRFPEKATLPAHVSAVRGDLLDIDSMRAALAEVSTLFLLAPNDADELTCALNTLSLAREAGVKGVVYLSVVRSREFTDVPHFAAKGAVERMIEEVDLPATILRPSYFFQNDVLLRSALLEAGRYAPPVGSKGISMVDVGDIADVAAGALRRREHAERPLPIEIVELSGPEVLTGPALAEIWSGVLDREIRYNGDDLEAFENQLRAIAPAWKAFDLRLMFQRYQQDGAAATRADIEKLTKLLGRPPRAYGDFAAATARAWRNG